jgi:hypothetical protein
MMHSGSYSLFSKIPMYESTFLQALVSKIIFQQLIVRTTLSVILRTPIHAFPENVIYFVFFIRPT